MTWARAQLNQVRARLAPPGGLRQRISWSFLLAGLWVMFHMGLLAAFGASPAPQRLVAAVGLVLVGVAHVTAYRRDRLPPFEFLFEAAALSFASHHTGDVRQSFGLFVVPLFFRCQYGRLWEVAGAIVSNAVAFFVIVRVWPSLMGQPPLMPPAEMTSNVIGILTCGSFAAVVAFTARRHERAAARERALARAGAGLVAAVNRDHVQATALEAAQGVLADTPISRVSLSLLDETHFEVVASAGRDAEAARGTRQEHSRIPARYRTDGTPKQVAIDAAQAAELAPILGFEPHVGVLTLSPLMAKAEMLGVLVVESPAALPSECADALATLSAEIGLALDAARLTEHLRRDIVRREAVESQLTELAFYDPLTRLANRAMFIERTQLALRHPGASVAVLYLDIDNFKRVNDSLGHAAGDELLTAVAERLRASVRPDDLVARLGGDEFTVLLESVMDVTEATRVADRIIEALADPVRVQDRWVTVSSSIGVALHAGEDAPGDLLQAADVALYVAKQRGKAQTAVFDPAMSERALQRLELEADLRQAIESRQLMVHYQPLIRLEDGRVVELEALVRWRHPRRGLVGPADFIPLAEETGLIVPLGQWVLETACRQTVAWQEAYPSETQLVISVNLSGKQLSHPGLVEDVQRILEETGLDPSALQLEITESIAVADTQANRDVLWGLRQLGVRLAIDDFGTGNAALNYLRRFPVDTLKIDRSFVEELGLDARTTAMVRGIIAFAKSLGLSVTGEGVETAEQSAHLRSMGCDWGQGYLFARPVSADRIDAVLARESLPEANAA